MLNRVAAECSGKGYLKTAVYCIFIRDLTGFRVVSTLIHWLTIVLSCWFV